MPTERLRLLVAALWAGSLWAIGYIAAPTLFALLERPLAGTVAAALFRIEAWLSVVCALSLFALLSWGARAMDPQRRRSLRWLVATMLVCTLIGYFALQPFMAELRAAAGAGGVMEGEMRSRFGMLHGIASAFYLLQSVLAAVLLWKMR